MKPGDFPGGSLVKTPNAGGIGSIPGWGPTILYVAWCGQKTKIS